MTSMTAGHKLVALLGVLVSALPVLKASADYEYTHEDGGAGMRAANAATDAMLEGFGKEEALFRWQRHIAEHGATNQTFISLVESAIQEWTDQVERESAEPVSEDFAAARRRQQQNVNRTHIL